MRPSDTSSLGESAVAPRIAFRPHPQASRRREVPRMERILTSELAAHAGERVLLQGWLHRKRELSRVSFLVLRDRAGLAQIVLSGQPEGVSGSEPQTLGTKHAPG